MLLAVFNAFLFAFLILQSSPTRAFGQDTNAPNDADPSCIAKYEKLISDKCSDGILAYGKCVKKYGTLATKLASSCCKFGWCSPSMTNQLCCTPSS